MTGVVNRLLGITPTVSYWDTPPDNLGNATDDDWLISTGIGSKVRASAGSVGKWHFDMGAVYTVLMLFKVGIWSTANEMKVAVFRSNNGSTWQSSSGYNLARTTSTTEMRRFGFTQLVRARYLLIRLYLTGAGTGYGKLYEAQGLEFPDVAGVN